MRKLSRHVSVVVVASSMLAITPVNALFKGIPVLEQAEDAGKHIVHEGKKGIDRIRDEGGKLLEKGLKELGNGLADISKEAEKLVVKVVKEIGNAGEDLVVLVKTGKCGGEVCIALGATVGYVKGTIKGYGKALKDAGERIAEGKPLDAAWHLSVAQWDVQQEAAAEAAMKSSIIRAVGQVAAGVYGGPYGAAAYAAWLTYHQTDGDLEASLKAAVLAGATAAAMSAISADVPLQDVAKTMTVDVYLKHAVMSGAVSGLAVALAGGDQIAIEQAFVKGAVTSVIRDGYYHITKSGLEQNMKPSTGEAYCLKAPPRSGLSCLPNPDAYVPAEGGVVRLLPNGRVDEDSIAWETTKEGVRIAPKIDFYKLSYDRPHVGTWSVAKDAGVFGFDERTGFMTGVSRLHGMNGMSIAHDIFAAATDPKVNSVIDMAWSIGTIAPFVVMTYEGAGFGVQEMIRKAAADSSAATPSPSPGVTPEPGSGTAGPGTGGETPQTVPDPKLAETRPVELRHLHCGREGGPQKDFLMEMVLQDKDPDDYERVCRIDQNLGGDRWAHLWHAHYQESFCIEKFNRIMRRQLDQGLECFASLGVRYDPVQTAASE